MKGVRGAMSDALPLAKADSKPCLVSAYPSSF